MPAATSDELVLTRELDAPREVVWKAWTDPVHLGRWWGPKGMTTRVVRFDLRVGGTFLYHMQRPDGSMWGKFDYKEIRPPERLVFVNSFSNERAEVTRAPFWDTWPLEIENRVTLTSAGERTRMELRARPLQASEREWETFREKLDNVTAGYNATLDELERLLAGAPAARNANTFTPTLVGDTEIEMTRVFDAPRGLVFLAHSKAEHLVRWWGPRDHVTTVPRLEFRPGGKYRFVQRTPDGQEVAFFGEFREIVPDTRMVWTFECEAMPGQVCVETVTLEERGGRTTLRARMAFPSKEARDGMVSCGMEGGARETWDRLEELVAEMR